MQVTVSSAVNTSAGRSGRLEMFLSTSFQPADWSYQFFTDHPDATKPLAALEPRHIRLQPLAGAIPERAPGIWDFTQLDAVVNPVLGVGDHSPEFQLAVAPAFMNDANGRLQTSRFQDFAEYCANLVRYYNTGGFEAGGKHYQSSSPYHITWWGIFNEPNINGIPADDYVTLYNLVAPAMQAVDPTLKFVAVELSDFEPEPENFLPSFVQKVTAQVDALATHYYSTCDQSSPDQSLFDSIAGFAGHVRYFYSRMAARAPLAALPVWVTENNVNADFDKGGGISACNGDAFVRDLRGSSAFFAAWRPLVFSRLAQAGAQSLYHWNFNSDAQFGEVDGASGNTYLSYWVDYWLARHFPSPPGANILQVSVSDPDIEVLAARNDDGSAVVMLANHAVASPADNNGLGSPRDITLDISALGPFAFASQVTIDASTDPSKGPSPAAVNPATMLQIPLNGYAVSFLRLNNGPPMFSAASVVSAATFAGGGVAPGEVVAVFGAGIGPSTPAYPAMTSPGFMDAMLAGTRILFDGTAAPLLYASSGQLNAIVPYGVSGQNSTQARIEYLGALSDAVTVPVVESAPGIFTLTALGTGQGAILNVTEAGLSVNSAANPAAPGSLVAIYATGGCDMTRKFPDGMITGSILANVVQQVSVRIGGLPAEVLYAGSAPDLVQGVIQINVRVPPAVTPGNEVPVQLTIGMGVSPPGATLAVR